VHNINASTFCVGPWIEVRVGADGALNFCHAAKRVQIPHNEYIQRANLDDYFSTGTSVQQARDLILQGHQVDRCTNCYRNDELNVVSFRTRRNLQYGIFPKQDFGPSVSESKFWQDIKADVKPRFYHISFSNLCNMSCLMCNPTDSSLFATTQQRANGVTPIQPTLTDWTQGPAWDQFCDHILDNDRIFCIHIMGGEPMYHKRFKEFLTLLNQKSHTDFHFTFVTNGSVFDSDVVALLHNFRSTTVEISLETVTLANDYIRRFAHPTQHVINNIDQWCQHRSENFNVVLRSVPQALSVLDYDQLLDYAWSKQLLIDSNWMHHPEFLQSNILPEKIKKIVSQRLAKFLNKAPDIADINLRDQSKVWKNLQNNARAVLDQMNSDCNNPEIQRKQFAEWCARFDRERGIHAADYVPELLHFLNYYHYELLNSDLP